VFLFQSIHCIHKYDSLNEISLRELSSPATASV
jgi:hypothetical protein